MSDMMERSPDYWTTQTACALCVDALKRNGISIRPTTDVREVFASIDAVGKSYLTPWLDPLKNDFSDENFFWLIAEKGGAPVIVGGGRLDAVGADASGYIKRLLVRGYGESAVADTSLEVSRRLSGSLCYLGDLYSKAGVGLARSNRRYFLGVANYIAATQFNADATYSFMRHTDVMRGSADTNGFDRRIFQPLSWKTKPDERSDSEVLVYRLRSENSSYFNGIIRELA